MRREWVVMIEKGGPGSGHWGHAGRPGQIGGSLPAGIYLALNKTTRRNVRISVAQCQRYGLQTGNEICNLLDRDGTIFSVIGGNHNSVILDKNDMGKASILVHNHPSSSSLSVDDVGIMSEHKLDHMIVIGHDGTLYRLSVTNKTVPWWFGPGTATAGYRILQDQRLSYWKNKVNSGMNYNLAWKEHSHEVVTRLAKQLGLDYKRIKP